ncbi:lymphocyte antigen 6H-like isoform X1 [Nycticebus coucang]|uniref:lymphocyte antigen 6H-like isoform X1 n=1 Tax=Nycticebus coucang TaxID=9470 RepID=UPI00234D3320|nr:lymphocyte antigen 6H-like isoform X1 [Nycticebus coucang]
MGGIHLFLLGILLCSKQALSLQCYTCTENYGLCLATTCQPGPAFCFTASLIIINDDGKKFTVTPKGCVPSCNGSSETIERMPGVTFKLWNPFEGLRPSIYEIKDLKCCDSDLCNGAAQVRHGLWTLAGALLISLGPMVVWALL